MAEALGVDVVLAQPFEEGARDVVALEVLHHPGPGLGTAQAFLVGAGLAAVGGACGHAVKRDVAGLQQRAAAQQQGALFGLGHRAVAG